MKTYPYALGRWGTVEDKIKRKAWKIERRNILLIRLKIRAGSATKSNNNLKMNKVISRGESIYQKLR